MADDDHGDKTEAATPRRLQRSREEGNVALSREVPQLVGLGAAALVLMMAGPQIGSGLALRLQPFFGQMQQWDLTDHGGAALVAAGRAIGYAAAPFAAAAMLGGIAAVLLQTGFVLRSDALMPKPSRIDPRAGLKRILGPDSAIEALKSVAKIGVMGMATWRALSGHLGALMQAPLWDPARLVAEATEDVVRVLLAVLAVQAVIAVGDVGWMRFRHARGLRMSREDIRQETKDTEGDPRIKQRVRQIRMQRARRRMMAAVPKATVVVTNPTHYAVALAYDRARNAAPRVVAKGMDSMAARIRELAQESGVPLVANPPLARALYRVELDTDIPPEHYKAVAEIIAYVWRLGRRQPRGAA
jgi:flagellar biosynthetic protein FlhB